MDDPQSLPVPIAEDVNQIALKEEIGLEFHDVVRIARRIAQAMESLDTILSNEEIQDKQWELLQKNPIYQAVYKQQAMDWNGIKGTQQRLALQALTGLEAGLPNLLNRLDDDKEDLKKVVDGYSVLAKIGGAMDYRDGNKASGEKFQININIGGEKTVIDVTPRNPTPIQHVGEGESEV